MSYAGVVEGIGPNVRDFAPGDRIATIRDGPSAADPRFGAYQQYSLASATSTAKLTDSVTFETAAASILNMAAVAPAFSIYMGMDRPSLTSKPTANSKKILIYGGSSSAGGIATCYATAAGYEVITTSSPENAAFVKYLGPAAVIDHAQPTEAILRELNAHGPYEAIFDAIGLLSYS